MPSNAKIIPLFGAILLAFTASASAQEQVVKIGHSGPLSGANAFAGKDNENGVRLQKAPACRWQRTNSLPTSQLTLPRS